MNRKVLFMHWKKASIVFLVIFFITAGVMLNPAFSPFQRFFHEIKIEESKAADEKDEKSKVIKEDDSAKKIELRGAAGSRAETWKSGFKIIADKPLFGIGPEVLKMVFPRYETELFRFKESFHVKQDRCHNSVFDKAVTRGIITLLIYIWVIFTVFKLGLKKIGNAPDEEGKLIITACLAGIASYLVQNQFSFGVVAIGSLLWIMMGIVSVMDEEKEITPKKYKPLDVSDIPWLPVAGIVISMFILLYISSIPFRADRFYKSGKVYTDRKIVDIALQEFDKSMSISPFEGGTNTYYGIAHLNKAYNVKDKKQKIEWFHKALDILKRASVIDPYNADNFYIAGKTYMTLYFEGERDGLDKSLKNSEKALKIDPYYAEAYHNKGLVYEHKGEVTLALANYERAFMINPKLSDSMKAMISLYSRLKLPKKAVESMERAYKKYPSPKYKVIENLGIAYVYAKRFDEAVETFEKMPMKKKGDKIKAKLNIALAYLKKGDLKSAHDTYLDVVILDPANVDARNNLGLIYFKTGNKEKAIEKFKEVLMIAPKNSYAKNMLKELEK